MPNIMVVRGIAALSETEYSIPWLILIFSSEATTQGWNSSLDPNNHSHGALGSWL